jgi:hypothetical protein
MNHRKIGEQQHPLDAAMNIYKQLLLSGSRIISWKPLVKTNE